MRRLPLALLTLAACNGSTPPPEVRTAAEPAREATTPVPVQPAPVATRRGDLADDYFGTTVADPYRWLEDVTSAEVQGWMADKASVARQHLSGLPARDAFHARLREIYYVESTSAPVVRGSRVFFSKRAKDAEKSVIYWRERADAEAKVLLDPHTMSADGSVSIGAWVPSEDGSKIAYLVKANNADESTLYVMDVATGKKHEGDTIEHLRYTSPSWAPDGSGFYYTWIPHDPNIPTNERMGYGEIRFHRLGTDPKADPTLREKTGDPERWMSASVSHDGKYLILGIHRGWAEQDVYVRYLKEKDQSWRPLAVGTKALYKVVAWKDRFYVATNDGAPRWKIYAVDARKLDRKAWKEIVREDEAAVLADMEIAGGHLGLAYLRNAASELQVRTLAGAFVRKVELPSIGSTSGFYGREEDDTAYFTFSSFLYPDEVWSTSMKTGATSLYARVEAPVDPSRFELEQLWFPSKDGTKVSMFVLRPKRFEKNGEAPAILYGYGGFNISITPKFSPAVYAWLERGGVYAIANLRGGGEYGEQWHQAGMLDRKQNVFDDFHAAAEHLIREKYTRADRLGASGRSNGGLLVGVAMTQRPDLFRAIVCGVPLLDMVRYTKVGIGKAWVPEYGDPDKAEHFPHLFAYSPYHRLQAGTRYPALLLTSVDSDDRVDPMHARKFMAMLEHVEPVGRTRLLRIEKNAGHSGGDMRQKAVEQAADELAFLWAELGGTQAAPAGSAVAR